MVQNFKKTISVELSQRELLEYLRSYRALDKIVLIRELCDSLGLNECEEVVAYVMDHRHCLVEPRQSQLGIICEMVTRVRRLLEEADERSGAEQDTQSAHKTDQVVVKKLRSLALHLRQSLAPLLVEADLGDWAAVITNAAQALEEMPHDRHA